MIHSVVQLTITLASVRLVIADCGKRDLDEVFLQGKRWNTFAKEGECCVYDYSAPERYPPPPPPPDAESVPNTIPLTCDDRLQCSMDRPFKYQPQGHSTSSQYGTCRALVYLKPPSPKTMYHRQQSMPVRPSSQQVSADEWVQNAQAVLASQTPSPSGSTSTVYRRQFSLPVVHNPSSESVSPSPLHSIRSTPKSTRRQQTPPPVFQVPIEQEISQEAWERLVLSWGPPAGGWDALGERLKEKWNEFIHSLRERAADVDCSSVGSSAAAGVNRMRKICRGDDSD